MHIGFAKKSKKKRKSKKKGKVVAESGDVSRKSESDKEKEKESSESIVIDRSVCEIEGKSDIGREKVDLENSKATSKSELLKL